MQLGVNTEFLPWQLWRVFLKVKTVVSSPPENVYAQYCYLACKPMPILPKLLQQVL